MQTTENLAFVRNTVERDRNQRGLHSIEQQKESVETQRRTESEKTPQSSKSPATSDVARELLGKGEE